MKKNAIIDENKSNGSEAGFDDILDYFFNQRVALYHQTNSLVELYNNPSLEKQQRIARVEFPKLLDILSVEFSLDGPVIFKKYAPKSTKSSCINPRILVKYELCNLAGTYSDFYKANTGLSSTQYFRKLYLSDNFHKHMLELGVDIRSSEFSTPTVIDGIVNDCHFNPKGGSTPSKNPDKKIARDNFMKSKGLLAKLEPLNS